MVEIVVAGSDRQTETTTTTADIRWLCKNLVLSLLHKNAIIEIAAAAVAKWRVTIA